ncbi:MAG: alpha/beta hydrolase [Burkholderia sp.]
MRIMLTPSTLLFLPGTSGDTGFWRPLADRFEFTAEREIFAHPRFGGEPADPSIRDIDVLLARVLARIEGHTAPPDRAIDGRHTGGARRARQARANHAPGAVRDLARRRHGRPGRAGLARRFSRAQRAPAGLLHRQSRQSQRAPAGHRAAGPANLGWGDDAPYRPVVVERLHDLLLGSALHVVPGGKHYLARVHVASLAPLGDAHLRC